MNKSTAQKYRMELQAPDGGWGYAVALAAALPLIGLNCIPSFGLLFSEFIKEAGGQTKAVTVIVGSTYGASSCAGLFSSSLSKKFSTRSVGIFGSLIFSLGSFMTIFATSMEYLFVSYSMMQGIGIGLMINVAMVNFNQYFNKRRTFMMSLTKTFIGICIMVYPILLSTLMTQYGFRGSVAIIAAINAHTIIAMLVMQPVEWHYKLVEVPICESELLTKTEGIHTNMNNALEKNKNERSRLSVQAEKLTKNTTDEIILKNERSKSVDPTSMSMNFEESMPLKPSHVNNGVSVKNPERNDNNGIWQKIVDFLDLTMLKDRIYLNIIIGLALAFYADNAFFTLLPLYLFELEFSPKNAAFIVAVAAAADLVSRILLVVVSFFVQIKARYIYLTSVIGGIITRLGFLAVKDYFGIAMVTASIGFFRSAVHIFIPIVIAEHVSQEKFASAFALFFALQGAIHFLLGLFIGWIRDFTHSFFICFITIIFVSSLCAIPWLIEIIWRRIYHRKNVRSNERMTI